jgi:hypothetical protein
VTKIVFTSVIDYIILKQKTNIKTQDVKVMRGAECGSDHYMVRGKLLFKYKPPLKNESPEKGINEKHTYPKYNIDSLQQDSVKFLFKLRLSAKLNTDVNQPPDTIYQALKTKIHEATKEALRRRC